MTVETHKHTDHATNQLTCLRTSLGMLSRRFSIERIMFPCPQISTAFPSLRRGTMRSLQNAHDRAWASFRDSVLGLPHHEAGMSSAVAHEMMQTKIKSGTIVPVTTVRSRD